MSRPSGRTFQLRTVRDFFQVPRDRRAQCFAEFQGWLAHVEVAVLKDAPTDVGAFIWTDDGVGGVRDLSAQQREGVRVQ